MNKEKISQEVLIIANAIDTARAAVKESSLGDILYKIDENKLGNDPRNFISNNTALIAFQIILQEKLKGMYDKSRITTENKT